MKGNYQFFWRTETAEFTEVHPVRRSYRDPTADEAIRNVMREECRQKKEATTKKMPSSRPRTRVWRAEEGENDMREKEVEKAFVEAVASVGGKALKFTSQTMNGVPDRLVLLLGGKCAFVELKAPGKQMSPQQCKRRQQLEDVGFPVCCVDRVEQIGPVIGTLKEWGPGKPIPKGVGAKIPENEAVQLPGKGSET